MRDCFGIETSHAEIRRWSELTTEIVSDWALRPYNPDSDQWDGAEEHFFKNHFPIEREELHGKIVMELGCGTGRNAAVVMRHADQYVGLDISVPSVALANQVFSRSHGFVDFYHTVYDADLMTAFEGRMGFVFGKYFFNHQPKERIAPMAAFAHRMLQPGGTLVIDRSRDLADLDPIEGEWVPGERWTGFVIEREWYVEMLAALGFGGIRFVQSELYVKRVERRDVLELVLATKEQ